MASIRLTPQTANTYLNRLLRDAAGPTESEGAGLKSKGLQITDALVDPNKKIKLKSAEVDRLLSHVDKLPESERAQAVECLDLFRDRFEVADDAARQKLLNFVPKTATPIEVGTRVRSVSDAARERATATPQASAADIRGADKVIDDAAAAAGAHGSPLADEMAAQQKQVFDDGDVKASADGGRKAYVETTAKRASTGSTPPNATDTSTPLSRSMQMFEQYSKSPWFEDRLMGMLGRNSLKFMHEMNDKLANFDDPKREAQIRDVADGNAKKMLALADQITPEGKARVAEQLMKSDPPLNGPPALMEWLEKVKKMPTPVGGASHDELLKHLPPADNAVIKAMEHSDRREVREWAAVFKAAESAEQIKQALPPPEAIKAMPEEEVRALHGQAKDFATKLKAMKSMLPQDLQDKIGDIQLDELPSQIDPTSRQVMFQQINLMMNQYQQIMQAMSETINKLNEMAMDPIRKMGR
jgi:chorismate mutase